MLELDLGYTVTELHDWTGTTEIKYGLDNGLLSTPFDSWYASSNSTSNFVHIDFEIPNLNLFDIMEGEIYGNGKRTSYSWHIELPNLNVSNEYETLGALNFCANNTSVAPGEEGVSLPRLVTFLRSGKVGIKNENPKVELHVIGKVSINDPATNKIVTGTHADYRLAVEGKLVAKEIIVTESNWNSWPDYVFKLGYKLMPLPEVEESIKQNGHLPGIPSAEDVRDNGINVAEVQAKMLEKIEELTLYMIEMKKENELLKQEINKLK